MINGRHLLLLGLLACAGLLSVHDGQMQTDLRYRIAAQEKELREIREQIALSRIKHTALQSPRAVMERASDLNLRVSPPSFAAQSDVPLSVTHVPAPATRSLGTARGMRPAPAPVPERAERPRNTTQAARQ